MLLSGRPARAPSNTRSPERGSAARSALACSDSGTVCCLPPFIRSAGTVQVRACRSISPQRAPIASPVRAAVRIVSSSARAPVPACCRSVRHEARHLGIGQRLVVLDRGDLRARRQQPLQVAAPTGRVVALAVAARRGPVQDALDPAAHPRGGLRLGRPDRLEDLHDEAGVDRADRQLADHRVGVGGDGAGPLRPVLAVLPARRHGRRCSARRSRRRSRPAPVARLTATGRPRRAGRGGSRAALARASARVTSSIGPSPIQCGRAWRM